MPPLDNVTGIILRERLANEHGEATGWLILLVRKTRVREILAVLAYEVGLNYARQFTRMLAAKYNVTTIEELARSEQAALVNVDIDNTDYGSPV